MEVNYPFLDRPFGRTQREPAGSRYNALGVDCDPSVGQLHRGKLNHCPADPGRSQRLRGGQRDVPGSHGIDDPSRVVDRHI